MLQKYVRLADAVNHDHTEHGDWATGQNYIVGDILQNDGGSYYCKLQHLSAAENEPGTGASWTTYWRIFAQGLKGDKGDTGAKGDKGDTGAPGADGADGAPGTPLGSVVWKGTYDAGTTYAAGDGCVSSDVAYVSIQNNNLNHAPPDASWWAPLGGSAAPEVIGEEPTGSGTSLTLLHTPISGTLRLYKNGVRLRSGAGNDYTISGANITLVAAKAKAAGDVFLADYNY